MVLGLFFSSLDLWLASDPYQHKPKLKGSKDTMGCTHTPIHTLATRYVIMQTTHSLQTLRLTNLLSINIALMCQATVHTFH